MNFLITLLLSIAATQANESALHDFVHANNLFAAAVYKEMKSEKNENFLLSPYSAESVLALVHSGSRGVTAEELRAALQLPEGKDQIEAGVKASFPLVKGSDKYILHTANKLYLKNIFEVRYGFHTTATKNFDVEIETVNFVENVEAANTINKWVKDQTHNKIENLVDPSTLDEDTKLVLINALYFQGNWSIPFDKYLTRKQVFYKSSEDVIEANTMHQRRELYDYLESSELNAKFLKLPFKGGNVSMVIALPNEKGGLSALENDIEKVLSTQDFSSTLVNIALPKFSIETTTDLKEILEDLGVEKLFDADKGADLSGIAGKPGELEVNKVLQKTFIDVEEKGVEAGSATSAEVIISTSMQVEPPKEFIADHPFIFYIKAQDMVIFAGRVISPSQ